MIRTALVLATLVSLALIGCREEASASPYLAAVGADPRETAAIMLELAEAGHWSSYVNVFYGETEKFRDDRDRWELIERFEGKWGEHAVTVLRDVTKSRIAPQISDDDSRATFSLGRGRQFTLYLDTDRRWKFHL